MNTSLTSGDTKEVIDWYNQINEKIQESGLLPIQNEWIIQLGGETLVSKFIAEHQEPLFRLWRELLIYGLEKRDRFFMGVLVSGLRKFMTNELRLEIAEFLTLEDRKLEEGLPSRTICDPKKLHGHVPEVADDCISRRKIIREVATGGLGVKKLEYDHQAKVARVHN